MRVFQGFFFHLIIQNDANSDLTYSFVVDGSRSKKPQKDSIRLIANICLIECIVAISPIILAFLIRCLTAGTIDAKSGIAGGVSTLMAIGTAALGISALVINSVEALGGTMGKCLRLFNGFCSRSNHRSVK